MRSRGLTFTGKRFGQSEIIGALIVLTAIIMLLLFLANTILVSEVEESSRRAREASLELQKSQETISIDPVTQCITNTGGKTIYVVRVWYANGTVRVLDPPLPIEPGSTDCSITGDPSVEAIVTSLGNVLFLKPQISSIQAGTVQAFAEEAGSVLIRVPQVVVEESILNPEVVNVSEELVLQPTEQNPGRGMIRYVDSRQAILRTTYEGTQGFMLLACLTQGQINSLQSGAQTPQTISPVDMVRVSNVYFGYATRPDSYNVLITGLITLSCSPDKLPVIAFEKNGDVDVYILGSNSDTGYYRIKIYGITGIDTGSGNFRFKYISDTVILDTQDPLDALGFWYYGYTSASCTSQRYGEACAQIYLRGPVDRVVVYEDLYLNSEFSYEPYLFVLDSDGNQVPELLFTTEEFDYGYRYGFAVPSCSVDDAGFLDESTDSANGLYFTFIDPDIEINSSEVAAIFVTVRLYFHDTEGGDTACVDNPRQGILVFALVDETGRIDSSYTLIYQQLDDIEDTWPPNRNFVTDTFSVTVPDTGKIYRLRIQIIDPYGFPGGSDDLDYTLALESIGVVMLARE